MVPRQWAAEIGNLVGDIKKIDTIDLYQIHWTNPEAEIFPYCEQNNIGVIIGVIVYSLMQSGLLTGTAERIANMPDDDWRKRNSEFQEPQLSRNLKLVELLNDIGQAHDRSSGEVAIAWTLRHSAVTGAIVGGRNPKQVEGTIRAATFRLNEDELSRIDDFLRNS